MKESLIRSAARRSAARRAVDRISPGLEPGGGPVDLSLHLVGLANPTRLKIVERLAVADEVGVTELAELCKVSQPRMSWHLRIMRRAQIITTRRDGREVLCRLDRPAIARHLDSFARVVWPDASTGAAADPATDAMASPPPFLSEVAQ